MPPRKSTLLVVLGVLLLTNMVWLLPHEGDRQYTYERSKIIVEGGTLDYRGRGDLGVSEENSLNPVDCQVNDDEHPRACAFDYYLVDHGPVSTPSQANYAIEPDFVELDGSYYRRTHNRNETSDGSVVVHDVERVSEQVVLNESAINVSGLSASKVSGIERRIAITGDRITTFEDLNEDQLGNVYRDDETYYTVVATDEHTIDHGIEMLRYELPRYFISLVGLALVGFGVLERTRVED